MSASSAAAEARRAARNAGAIAAASLVSKGALFLWQIALAHALGEALYGVYGAVGSFIAVGTSVVNFGMGPIVIRDVARRPDQAGKYLTATLVMQSALALLAYALVNGAAALGGYPADVRAFLALAAVSLLVDILGNMTNDILLAQERMVASSAAGVGHVVLLVLLAGAALLAGGGLWGVYAATIAAGLARSAVLWLLALRGGVRPRWPFDRAVAAPLLRNGAPLALAAFLALAYQHADKLMTARFIGPAETGHLTAAFVVVFGVVELLNTTILTATYPMMARYYGSGERFGLMVGKLAFFTLVFVLPLALSLSLFAAEITVPLFGPNFAPTADALRILIWYALASMIANVFAQALMVQNRQRSLLGIRAAGLAGNIALNLVLIPRLGVAGAALASLAAESVVLAVLLLIFRESGWQPARTLPRVARALAAGCLAALAALALRPAGPVIGIGGGLAVYAAAVWLLRALGADDLDLFYRLAAAMPGGTLVRRVWRRDTPINW